MNTESKKFLEKLINNHSPSGYEKESAIEWKNRTKKFTDKIKVDVHGNIIGVLNEKGNPKIMLAGHIDEVGYMIKYIDDNGYLYFSPIGGIDLHLLPGQRIKIKTKKGDILGLIGRKPIHLLEAAERTKVAKLENLWIDIGAKNKKEAESIVSIGDVAVPAVGFDNLLSDKLIGRGFDDRVGAFIVSECLRELYNTKIKASLYGVATVQEELGLRGARTSGYSVSPDIAIAIDVTFATDVPGIDKRKIGDISLGKGPVIARGPNINHKVFELLEETAKKNKIPYQIEGISRATGTDANMLQLNKSGVATGLISIPNRYMHTPVELVHLKDIENAVKLLTLFIKRIDNKINFLPY